ncbi:hypothetical protein ALON55S_08500 [Alishewanella longhuensis]
MRLHAEYQPETIANAKLGDKVQQVLDGCTSQGFSDSATTL